MREEDMEYIKQPVFLNTPLCKYSPYQMHCRRIYPGITLVVLTEVWKTTTIRPYFFLILGLRIFSKNIKVGGGKKKKKLLKIIFFI